MRQEFVSIGYRFTFYALFRLWVAAGRSGPNGDSLELLLL